MRTDSERDTREDVENGAMGKRRTGDTCTREESSPFVANIEHFRSVQEEVRLRAVCEARRNLLNAGLQDFRVEHAAINPGGAGALWRSVKWASTALVVVTSVLDRMITAMGVISTVFRHWIDLRDG